MKEEPEEIHYLKVFDIAKEINSTTNLDIANKMGFKPCTISNIKKGQHKPSLDKYIDLVEACGGEIIIKFPTIKEYKLKK